MLISQCFLSNRICGQPVFTAGWGTIDAGNRVQENERHAVLDTNPTGAAMILIEGWYGGEGLPSSQFNGTFVPA